MVEVKYEPYREVVIHEIKKMTLPDFLLWVASQVEAQKQGGVPQVDWIDGVAFVRGEYAHPVPDRVLDDQLNGRIHYPAVFFTETSYEPQKKVTLNGREVSIRINKAGDNPLFVDMVKFLKNFQSSSEQVEQVTDKEKSD